MTLKVGSLFAGYEGLGMGVAQVLDAEPVWFSEFDKGPSKILAHRFPGVPNHGDITKIDWATVEPVDILTGGSPCQDLSHAGKRQGMSEGTRSNLWVAMREAIAHLRPSLVVWENVRGAYSAGADSELESNPRLLAETRRRDGEPVLRALGRVLGDLSDLGYDAQWHGLRAADVGAPHGRFRVFVVAYPRGERGREGGRITDGHAPNLGRASAVPDQRGCGVPDAALLSTPQGRDYKGVPGDNFNQANLCRDVALLPTPACNDMGASYTPEEWDAWTERMKAEHGNGNGHGKSLHIEAARLLPTPNAGDAKQGFVSREQHETRAAAKKAANPNLGGLHEDLAYVAQTQLHQKDDDARSAEGRSGEVLRDVRGATDPQEVREREARGQDGVPQEAPLFPKVREQSEGDPARLAPMEGSADRESAAVPGVRDDRAPARTSPRQESSEQRPVESRDSVCLVSPDTALAGGPGVSCGCGTQWGQYEAAIRRWERVLGRCAPPPTQLGPSGRPRLDPRFSEFMMGLPAGWVTDVPGITRNEALKALGNGVVPQQAAAALRLMLGGGSLPSAGSGDLLPTPRSLDATGVRGVTANRSNADNRRAGATLTDFALGSIDREAGA